MLEEAPGRFRRHFGGSQGAPWNGVLAPWNTPWYSRQPGFRSTPPQLQGGVLYNTSAMQHWLLPVDELLQTSDVEESRGGGGAAGLALTGLAWSGPAEPGLASRQQSNK